MLEPANIIIIINILTDKEIIHCTLKFSLWSSKKLINFGVHVDTKNPITNNQS